MIKMKEKINRLIDKKLFSPAGKTKEENQS